MLDDTWITLPRPNSIDVCQEVLTLKILSLAIALLILYGCASKPTTSLPQPMSETSRPPYAHEHTWCGTLRGNGQQRLAHWASLARLTELYGPPAALVGGSSSSMTMLLTESILMNPYFSEAYFAEAPPEPYHEDVAFLFKSLQGYVAGLENIRLVKASYLILIEHG